MPSILDNYNPSILALPAYYILSVLPHSYAITVASQGTLTKWDNRNPRSTTMKSHLKDTLPSDRYALYERAEACHANGMENLPIFATAVVLGNLAGLKQEGLDGLNGFAGVFLAIRALYTAVYLRTKTQGPTTARSALWLAGTVLCFRVIIRAAKALRVGRVVL